MHIEFWNKNRQKFVTNPFNLKFLDHLTITLIADVNILQISRLYYSK